MFLSTNDTSCAQRSHCGISKPLSVLPELGAGGTEEDLRVLWDRHWEATLSVPPGTRLHQEAVKSSP